MIGNIVRYKMILIRHLLLKKVLLIQDQIINLYKLENR